MKEKMKSVARSIGPGIIFASMAIGETHFALLTYAGAKYGFALLWMVFLVHLVYYPNFEYGTRYAAATGKSLMGGYGHLKAGRFMIRLFLIMMVVTPILIMSSLVGLAGSVLHSAFPAVDFRIWCLVIYVVTVLIVIRQRFKILEQINKVLILIMLLVSVLVFMVSPPSAGQFVLGLIPTIPPAAGVMAVVVAILRVPTDPASSIFLSEWAAEKRKEWLGNAEFDQGRKAVLNALERSIFDFRIGFFISFLIGVIFLSVGATVLKPLGIVPEGVTISLKLSEIYTQTLGQWIFPVFIIMLFAAFWGGYLSAMDGIMRLAKDLIHKIFKVEGKSLDRLAIVYILAVATFGLTLTIFTQRPMVMVLIAVSIGLVYYPFIFGLNIYCVTKLVDEDFRPGKLNLALAICGFFVGTGGFILLILVRVLKVIE